LARACEIDACRQENIFPGIKTMSEFGQFRKPAHANASRLETTLPPVANAPLPRISSRAPIAASPTGSLASRAGSYRVETTAPAWWTFANIGVPEQDGAPWDQRVAAIDKVMLVYPDGQP
jgi:hypothetical protein